MILDARSAGDETAGWLPRSVVMEKARRKRVNTCLDQLRSLLPFTTTLKRDMASLLEQTVEYINTMHTVLNEDKPACLSKIYTVYQKKIEEHDLLRKGSTPKSSKRKISGAGSCSHGHDTEQPSPEIFHACTSNNYCTTQHPSADENDPKRQCFGLSGWDQSIIQQAMSTPKGPFVQTRQPQQHIIESTADLNNNGYMHPFSGVPYGGDWRGGMPGPSCYVFGQSPLANQYSVTPKPTDQQSPFPSGKYLPFSNFCSGLPRLYLRLCVVSPSMENAFQREATSGTASQEENEIKTEHNDESCFSISSLASSCDQHNGSTMQMASPSLWHQYNFQSSVAPYNNCLLKNDNPTHNLLAPMDMSESPRNDPTSNSPHFMGVGKLFGKGRKNVVQGLASSGREMGILLKSSSVSNMLNEVTGMNAVDYPRVFGSTERKVTPVLGFMKDHSHSFCTRDDGLSSAVVIAMGKSASARAENGEPVQMKVPTPCTSRKSRDEIIGVHSSRTGTPNQVLKNSAASPLLVADAVCPDGPGLVDANQKNECFVDLSGINVNMSLLKW